MMQCWRWDAQCDAKRRVNQAKDASKRCKVQLKNAQGKLELKARWRRWSTHDWALDLEPLALPPDLPPVILRELVWGLVWKWERLES